MELSMILAQVMGLSLFIFAIAGLVRPQLIKTAIRDVDHESFSTLAIGFILVSSGLALVLTHNIWVMDWPVLVTLFGWGTLGKGITYLMVPQSLVRFAKIFYGDPGRTKIVLAFALILGAYLAYKGFGN